MLGSGDESRAIGAMEIILNDQTPHPIYSYMVKKEWEKYVSYRIADDSAGVEALKLLSRYGRSLKAKMPDVSISGLIHWVDLISLK